MSSSSAFQKDRVSEKKGKKERKKERKKENEMKKETSLRESTGESSNKKPARLLSSSADVVDVLTAAFTPSLRA